MRAQLIISTRNRPEFLIKTIESALTQTVPFERIIVSDNSSKSAAQRKLMEKVISRFADAKSLSFYRTNRDLSPHEHFQFIQHKFIPSDNSLSVVFHDDDEFLPDFHSSIIKIFNKNKRIVAISCNAKIIDVNLSTEMNLMRTKKEGGTLIHSKHQFFDYYLNFNSMAPAPFPAYCYRSHLLKKINFSSDYGGKYSDVAGLSQLLDHGQIFWLNNTLIKYRIHPLQDSKKNDIRGRRLLARYVDRQCGLEETRIMREAYRVKYLLPRVRLLNLLGYRERKIIKFATTFFMTRMISSKTFYVFLISIIKNKIRER
jgi:glycosyltransferase involved in cell wall biosynthesis